MVQKTLLTWTGLFGELSAVREAVGVMGTLRLPRVPLGSHAAHPLVNKAYAWVLSVHRGAFASNRWDRRVLWGTRKIYFRAPGGSRYGNGECKTALLASIMQQARKGAHAKGLKSLEGTAPPASEASRPYGTAAAITTSAAEKLTDASANTRVLAAGEDAGEAADDICSSNGTMSNSDDATSDNHLGGETTKTTNGSISSSNSNNSCNGSVLGALNVVRTAEEGDILRGLKVRAQ